MQKNKADFLKGLLFISSLGIKRDVMVMPANIAW
jgi:hypothetical protein